MSVERKFTSELCTRTACAPVPAVTYTHIVRGEKPGRKGVEVSDAVLNSRERRNLDDEQGHDSLPRLASYEPLLLLLLLDDRRNTSVLRKGGVFDALSLFHDPGLAVARSVSPPVPAWTRLGLIRSINARTDFQAYRLIGLQTY